MQIFERFATRSAPVASRTISASSDIEDQIAALPGLSAWYEAADPAGRRWQFGTDPYPPRPDEVALQAKFNWLSRVSGPAPADPAKAARAGRAWIKTASPRANADERPRYMAGVTPTGRAALRIGQDADGGQTVLTQDSHSGALETDQGNLLAANSYFMAWVARVSAAQTGDCVLLGNARNNASQAFQVMTSTTSSGRIKIIHQSAVVNLTITSAFTAGVFQLFSLGWDLATQKITLRRNGAQIAQATGVTTPILITDGGADLSIGAGGAQGAAGNAQFSSRADFAGIWAGTVNLTDPKYAAQLGALESYAMSSFITP